MSAIKVLTLGAGRDIGRSCVVVNLGGRRIMFDCGMHMGYHDHRRFPDWRQLGTKPGEPPTGAIDCVVITHFHLDHIGGLPYLTEKMGYDGPIYMTHPTAAISAVLLKDYVHVTGGRTLAGSSYSPEDVDACLRRVTTVTLGESFQVDKELVLKTHYAGHVIGAVMVSAECLGHRVLYTGDFNTVADRHLGAACVGRLEPHVLITESTYATSIRESKRCREADFLRAVHATVAEGGKVLIPSFAVGRAQELLMLLETYWERMGLQVPIYCAAGMAQHATMFYRLFAQWTSPHVQDLIRATGRNPFDFHHVHRFERSLLDKPGPCVLFATSAMMNAGMALEAFRHWADDSRNLVIFPSYCFKGTIGHALLRGANEVVLDGRQGDAQKTYKQTVKCAVKQISFSAHADAKGILSLIRTVKPAAVVLVHGERHKMAYLKVRVSKLFGIPCLDPENGESLKLPAEQQIAVQVSSALVRGIIPESTSDTDPARALDGYQQLARQAKRRKVESHMLRIINPWSSDVPVQHVKESSSCIHGILVLQAQRSVNSQMLCSSSASSSAEAQALPMTARSPVPKLQLISAGEMQSIVGLAIHSVKFQMIVRSKWSCEDIRRALYVDPRTNHADALQRVFPWNKEDVVWKYTGHERCPVLCIRSVSVTSQAVGAGCGHKEGGDLAIRWSTGDEALAAALVCLVSA